MENPGNLILLIVAALLLYAERGPVELPLNRIAAGAVLLIGG